MIKVAIVEDLPAYRSALETLLNESEGYACVGAYESAEGAIREIPVLQPDVVLADINLPTMNGIDLVRAIRDRCPNTLCMMCTAYDEDEKVFRALEAGAHGYILKSTSPVKIIEAITDLRNGGSPMSNEIARKVVTAFNKKTTPQLTQLSAREKEILQLLVQGLLYKEIALQLGISIETVKRHCFNIYHKLHVSNRSEAIGRYYDNQFP